MNIINSLQPKAKSSVVLKLNFFSKRLPQHLSSHFPMSKSDKLIGQKMHQISINPRASCHLVLNDYTVGLFKMLRWTNKVPVIQFVLSFPIVNNNI